MARGAIVKNNLSLQQLDFCKKYVENGGNASKAALEAGYRHERQQAHFLLSNQHVNAEIERLSQKKLNNLKICALNTIEFLINNSENEKIKLDAAKTILDRSGMNANQSQQQTTNKIEDMSVDELTKYINSLKQKKSEEATIIDAEVVEK